MSINRRLSAGAPFTSSRSSGENITAFSAPISSPVRFAISLSMNICLRSPLLSFISIVRPPLFARMSMPTYPPAKPARISSASFAVLCERPKAHKKIASTALVLPCAFSPTITFRPLSGRSRSDS